MPETPNSFEEWMKEFQPFTWEMATCTTLAPADALMAKEYVAGCHAAWNAALSLSPQAAAVPACTECPFQSNCPECPYVKEGSRES